LDEHPYIVNARWVEEFSGRLFVQMDYIAPDKQGRTSLQDHLTNPDGSIDSVQLLTWGVQFCLGMEHAVSRGVKCHRDIKPGNILITNERTLKIADFGLATAAEAAWRRSSEPNDSRIARTSESHLGLSVFKAGGKSWCGTPGYVSPELYRHGMVDIRSDIYSFGLVLWQMATGSTAPPFLVRYDGTLDEFMQAVYRRQTTSPLPPVDGPIHQVIKRCVSPTPSKRYSNFRELRDDLTSLLQDQTGQSLRVPTAIDQSAVLLFQKGGSLISLGRYERMSG
jgi:serine/threonine protein kinase